MIWLRAARPRARRIHHVAEDVAVAVDERSAVETDAAAELAALDLGHGIHSALHGERRAGRAVAVGKHSHHLVADGLDDASALAGDLVLEKLHAAADGLEGDLVAGVREISAAHPDRTARACCSMDAPPYLVGVLDHPQ
jgi:hypothetical protein